MLVPGLGETVGDVAVARRELRAEEPYCHHRNEGDEGDQKGVFNEAGAGVVRAQAQNLRLKCCEQSH